MGYPVHPLANIGVAGQYLNQLSPENISQRYFNNQETYQSTFWNRFKLIWTIDGTLSQLKSFYPYVPVIKRSHESYREEMVKAVETGLVCTAVSWVTIFNLARRGKVLPFFRQYGQFFKTHRVFRQYLFSLIVPTTILTSLVDFKYLNHTEALWAVHSRRMNQHLTSDPSSSEYPEELLPTSYIGSWITNYVSVSDKKTKKANETSYLLAPDREEIEFAAEDLPSEEEDEDDEDAEAAEEEEDDE